MLKRIVHALQGKHPVAAKRSAKWPKVRLQHLVQFSECAVCGSRDKLEVHHISPFHLNPTKELDPTNLITLCESKKGGINCHLFAGHMGNYKLVNEHVLEDASYLKQRIHKARNK